MDIAAQPRDEPRRLRAQMPDGVAWLALCDGLDRRGKSICDGSEVTAPSIGVEPAPVVRIHLEVAGLQGGLSDHLERDALHQVAERLDHVRGERRVSAARLVVGAEPGQQAVGAEDRVGVGIENGVTEGEQRIEGIARWLAVTRLERPVRRNDFTQRLEIDRGAASFEAVDRGAIARLVEAPEQRIELVQDGGDAAGVREIGLSLAQDLALVAQPCIDEGARNGKYPIGISEGLVLREPQLPAGRGASVAGETLVVRRRSQSARVRQRA